ncbi:MAG: S9 family peptidase, partial [Pseudomonadota bacterium]
MHKFLLPISILMIGAATAAEEEEFNRFKADHVFDLEYADDPQISPDGEAIVYIRRYMDKMEDRVSGILWEIDLKSGDHRPVQGGANAASGVRWSPSGDRVVYMGQGEQPEIRVLYRDSGESFSLAQLEERPGAPVWSPDGT